MRKANKTAFTSRRYRELMQNNRFECYKHIDANPSSDVAICPHHHAFYEIIFVVKGDLFYEVEGRPYHLSHGDVILIDELQFHHGLIHHQQGYERYALWVHPKYMQLLAKRFPKLDPQYCFLQLNSDNNNLIHLSEEEFADIEQDLSHLFESYWSKTPSDEVLSESYFAIILTKLNQLVHRQHCEPDAEDSTQNAVAANTASESDAAYSSASATTRNAATVQDADASYERPDTAEQAMPNATEGNGTHTDAALAEQIAATATALNLAPSSSLYEIVNRIEHDDVGADASSSFLPTPTHHDRRLEPLATPNGDGDLDSSAPDTYGNVVSSTGNGNEDHADVEEVNGNEANAIALAAQDDGSKPAPMVTQAATESYNYHLDDEMHLNLQLSERLKLSALLKYINLNINENLSLDELSQRFNLSKFYLTRRFKELTGLSLHQFIVKKRLTKARYLISVGVDPYRAAVDAGFNNYSHFSRTFKSYFGQNPSSIPQAHTIHHHTILSKAQSSSGVVMSDDTSLPPDQDEDQSPDHSTQQS